MIVLNEHRGSALICLACRFVPSYSCTDILQRKLRSVIPRKIAYY